MVCFINSGHVMFSSEFAFCPFINYAYLICTWMHAHRTKLERDSSLKYHHVNGETKHTSWKGQLLSWVNTSISANRIMHHAPFIVTSIISVSVVVHFLPILSSQIFNHINIASTPGFEPGSPWWEGGGSSALSTVLLSNVREDYIRVGLRIFETGS